MDLDPDAKTTTTTTTMKCEYDDDAIASMLSFEHPEQFSYELSVKGRPGTAAAGSPFYSQRHYPHRVMLVRQTALGFRYWLFPNAASAAWQVAQSARADRQWFFQIEAARPVYAYLDIDRRAAGSYSREQFHRACRHAVRLFARFVEAYYARQLWSHQHQGDDNVDEHWFLYDASTEHKWSMHAHSQRVQWDSVDELHTVVDAFLRWLRREHAVAPRGAAVHELFARDQCMIDGSVYTKRPFRLPYNRKSPHDDNVLYPLHAVRDDEQQRDILRGFVHPVVDSAEALVAVMLPTEAELRRVRAACANALRYEEFTPAADLTELARHVHELLRNAWPRAHARAHAELAPAPLEFADDAERQRVVELLCAHENASDEQDADARMTLLAQMAFCVEQALLVASRPAQLADFAERGARLLGDAMRRCGVSLRTLLDECELEWQCQCETAEQYCARWLSLELAADTDPSTVQAFLRLNSCDVPRFVCTLSDSFADFRRLTPGVFCVPENAITVDRLRLALADPLA